jgi:hypothetical protein
MVGAENLMCLKLTMLEQSAKVVLLTVFLFRCVQVDVQLAMLVRLGILLHAVLSTNTLSQMYVKVRHDIAWQPIWFKV